MQWYEYPVTVAFGNGDVKYGGAHDLDVGTPPNTLVTAALAGTVRFIGSPIWGMSVGIELDTPFNNIPFMGFLHLAAVSPKLAVGVHINPGDEIGWSGGCTDASQYDGTSNPTGKNFVNDPSQSSQPQTGIALMRGPEYGAGLGWTLLPDPALDATPLLEYLLKHGIKPAVTPGGMTVPRGWSDDGQTLTAPNRQVVIHGFREYILNTAAWDSQDVPLEREHFQNPLEEGYSQPENQGSRQTFNYSMLAWNPARNVYRVGLGNEYLFVYNDRARLRSQIATALQQLAALQQQLSAPGATLAQALAQVQAIQAQLQQLPVPVGR